MTPLEQTEADFRTTGLTTGPHPMAHLREALRARGVSCAADLAHIEDGRDVTCAGIVIVRQRPGTAKGFLFLTLEDETGFCNAIVRPDLYHAERRTILGEHVLAVAGRLQRQNGVVTIRAARFHAIDLRMDADLARDFH